VEGFMLLPTILPRTVESGQGPGLEYSIAGELVPALVINLEHGASVYFEHHVVLWEDPGLNIGLKALKGAFKRVVAGMPIFMTEAVGPGSIAFSRDGAGHVFPIHLKPNQSILVREHQFLAATSNLEYTISRVKGVASMLFGGTGFFVDKFTALGSEGIVWLHGYGNVFEQELVPGEQIDVEPGGWIYRDESVSMDIKVYGLRTGIFGGQGQLIFNRFTDPGKVGIQTMYIHMPTAE